MAACTESIVNRALPNLFARSHSVENGACSIPQSDSNEVAKIILICEEEMGLIAFYEFNFNGSKS